MVDTEAFILQVLLGFLDDLLSSLQFLVELLVLTRTAAAHDESEGHPQYESS